MLQAWYPGTSGGEAIARVLFAEVNPSGRLPATIPVSESQLPRPKLDGDPKNEAARFTVDYHEGAAVGDKWFDLKGVKPLFPFGHGLSSDPRLLATFDARSKTWRIAKGANKVLLARNAR